MTNLQEAKAIYAEGRFFLTAVRSAYPTASDRVIWGMEDLEDALLDLKQAVMDGSVFWMNEYAGECKLLMKDLREIILEE